MAGVSRGKDGGSRLLGEMLVGSGTVSQDQLNRALDRQRRFGGRLASHCFALGFQPQRALLVHLSRQLGYPAIDLSRSVVKIPLLGAIPYEIAVKVLALPIASESDRLLVALAEPHRRDTVDEIAFRTGKRVIPHVALEIALRETIERCYTFARAGAQDLYLGEEADLTQDVENGFASVVTSDDLPQVPAALREAVGASAVTAQLAPVPGAATGAVSGSTGGKRVLIVDDDPELLKLCERLLRPLKAEITLAGTGSHALEAIRNTLPDLILLDAMLPEVHGFEICRQVKSSSRFQSIPVIMMSAVYRGWRFREDILNVYRADAFVEKPFDINQLYRLAEDLLSRSGGQSRVSDPALAQIAVEEAEALVGAEKFDEAEARLGDALREQPFVAPLRLLMGRVKLARGLPYEAMNEFERAVELAPNLFAALKELAILYQERGFRRKAAEVWERAKASCPDPSLISEIDQHLRNIT